MPSTMNCPPHCAHGHRVSSGYLNNKIEIWIQFLNDLSPSVVYSTLALWRNRISGVLVDLSPVLCNDQSLNILKWKIMIISFLLLVFTLNVFGLKNLLRINRINSPSIYVSLLQTLWGGFLLPTNLQWIIILALNNNTILWNLNYSVIVVEFVWLTINNLTKLAQLCMLILV